MNDAYLRQVHAAKTAYQRNSQLTEADGQTPPHVKITWRKANPRHYKYQGPSIPVAVSAGLPSGGIETTNAPSAAKGENVEMIEIWDQDMEGKPYPGHVTVYTVRASYLEKKFSSESAAKSWADKQPLDLKGFKLL